MSRLKRCSILLFAVILFSLDNILLKGLPNGTSPLGILTLSCCFAAPVLTVVFRKHLKEILQKQDIIYIVLLSASFACFNFLNISSLKYLNVNDSSFIFSLTVAIVPIISLFMGKWFPLTTWLGVIVIVGGVWFASGVVFDGDELVGGILSFAGAVVRAFFLIGLNRVSKRVDCRKMLVILVWMSAIFSALLWLAPNPSRLIEFNFNMRTLLPIIGFSLLSVVIANSMVILMQKYATEVETAVILSVQLIFTVLFMSIIPEIFETQEPLTYVNAAGCLLIVLGSILATCDIKGMLLKRRKLKQRILRL